ncbi:hypothetical protein AQUCO_00200898v1 [Aquilegia coerulea]|uniref:phosphoserine phosphatase n=1 Tax=Aquilegia coerulea TaxID=218851 RepID=A0A2G5F5I2_AQUCA|nr:hypothetical protein AQUCO_00200898v1 [Aquilegia coerulea]PIA63196.1 hypothetical protein AQUCO_00200898v1 [Aquilegia coerulea]
MEGLISARTINPIRSQSCSNRFLQSPLFPEVAHCTTQKLYNYPVKLMTQFKSIAPMTTSAQSTDSITPAHLNNTLPSKDVLEIWRNADAVCFDVDSTVCLDEGIDELAEFCGAGKAVAEWTVRISPGIDELITKLKANNTDVYLVSGGFRQMIQPVALLLGIKVENIYANQLLFGSSGEFVGFDKNEPTSRSGGKATAVQQLRKAHEYKRMVMIGDGATDLEARKPGGADLFICYAGVQLRDAVAAKADWLVFNFNDLINSLE